MEAIDSSICKFVSQFRHFHFEEPISQCCVSISHAAAEVSSPASFSLPLSPQISFRQAFKGVKAANLHSVAALIALLQVP